MLLVLSFILHAQISVKWPEIPFLLLPWEALSQQAPCGAEGTSWEGASRETLELFSANLSFFFSLMLIIPTCLFWDIVPFYLLICEEKNNGLGWSIEWLFTGWLLDGVTHEEVISPGSLCSRGVEQGTKRASPLCQSFPSHLITKQLGAQKGGGREWRRAVLSLMSAYICSWSPWDLFIFFLPEPQSA